MFYSKREVGMFISRSAGQGWGLGLDERKNWRPSWLTVESGPHEQVEETELSTSESGFLLGTSSD